MIYVVKVLNFGIIGEFVIFNYIMKACLIKTNCLRFPKSMDKLIMKKAKRSYFKVRRYIVMLMKKYKINSVKWNKKMKKVG